MKLKTYDWTGFSDRERMFCYEYLTNKNKTACAISVGFSEKSAQQQSQRVYTKCKERINEMLNDIAAPHQVTASRVIAELEKIGFMNAKQFYNNKGEPIPIQDLSDDAAACIAGMKVMTQESDDGDISALKEYKLFDKLDALTKLGQNLQMFTKKLVIEDKRPTVVIKDMTGRKKKD